MPTLQMGEWKLNHPAVEGDSQTLKRVFSPPFSSSTGVSGEDKGAKEARGRSCFCSLPVFHAADSRRRGQNHLN